MAASLSVKAVANDSLVWEGEAKSVVVRTTEGDMGVRAGHMPIMAKLVPHAAEILTPDGDRLILAISGGLVSVFENHVSILSPYGELAEDISVEDAESGIAMYHDAVSEGTADERIQREYRRFLSQRRAATKFAQLKRK